MSIIVQPAQPIAGANKAQDDRRAIFVTSQNADAANDEPIDLLLAQQQNRFGQLRTVYIDTSKQAASDAGLTLVTDKGQNITVPPQSQGYYPVFVPYVSKLNITAVAPFALALFDFSMPSFSWRTVADSGGSGLWSFKNFESVIYPSTPIVPPPVAVFSLPIPAATINDDNCIIVDFDGTLLNNTGATQSLYWYFWFDGQLQNTRAISNSFASSTVPHPLSFRMILTPIDNDTIRCDGLCSMGRAISFDMGDGLGDLQNTLTAARGIVSPFTLTLPANSVADSVFNLGIFFLTNQAKFSFTRNNIIATQV